MERSPYSEETTLLLREAGIDKGMTEREEAEMNIERVEIMHEAGEISTAEFHDYIAQFKEVLLADDEPYPGNEYPTPGIGATI